MYVTCLYFIDLEKAYLQQPQGKETTIFPNTLSIYAELKESTELSDFKEQGNVTDTVGETALIALAQLSSDHLLLLVELDGGLKIGKAVDIIILIILCFFDDFDSQNISPNYTLVWKLNLVR